MSAFTRVLLEDNPSPMTLEGTNTWILRASDSGGVVVIDPGQITVSSYLTELNRKVGGAEHDPARFEAHIGALATLPIELILLTHHHVDHAEGAPELSRLTGAPIRAFAPDLNVGADPLTDGEIIRAAGIAIEVVHTPGHSYDSVSFFLPEDGEAGAMLTGDMILGRGSTVLGPEQNALGEFLDSLDRYATYGDAAILTGHGAVLPSLKSTSDEYAQHRKERLDQVSRALDILGTDASAEQVVDLVYTDLAAPLRPAAISSTTAQLEYLRSTH